MVLAVRESDYYGRPIELMIKTRYNNQSLSHYDIRINMDTLPNRILVRIDTEQLRVLLNVKSLHVEYF